MSTGWLWSRERSGLSGTGNQGYFTFVIQWRVKRKTEDLPRCVEEKTLVETVE